MICKKCGNTLNDGSRFCPECGWDSASDENVQSNGVADGGTAIEPNAGAEPAGDAFVSPSKPPVNKKIIISAIAAVLVILIAVGAFAGSAIKNSISRMFMSPDEYLLHVQQRATEEFANDLAKQFGFMKNNLNMSRGGSGSINVVLGEDLKKLILAQADEESAKLVEWIDSAGLTVDASNESTSAGYGLGLLVNDIPIASADIVLDFTDEAMYVAVPEINEQGIKIPFNAVDISPEASAQMLDAMEKMVEIVPDERIISELICRYMNAVTSQIKDVTESKERVTVGAISKKCTLLTARINNITAMNIAQTVFNEFVGDQDVKDIIYDFAEFAGEDGDVIVAELEDAAKENVKMIEEAKADAPSDEAVILKVWVDSEGNINGIGFAFEDELEIVCNTLADGKKFATDLTFKVPATVVSVKGAGKQSGGRINGKYTVEMNDTELVSITVEDFDEDAVAEGKTNGKFIIEPSSKLAGVLELADESFGELAEYIPHIRLELAVSSESGEGSTEMIVYYKDKMFATLELEGKASDDVEVLKPESNADYSNIQAWVQSVKFDKVSKALKEAGASEELLEVFDMSGNAQ